VQVVSHVQLADKVAHLHESTGFSIGDCLEVLRTFKGDHVKAREYLALFYSSTHVDVDVTLNAPVPNPKLNPRLVKKEKTSNKDQSPTKSTKPLACKPAVKSEPGHVDKVNLRRTAFQTAMNSAGKTPTSTTCRKF
jgi:hypothetical protein